MNNSKPTAQLFYLAAKAIFQNSRGEIFLFKATSRPDISLQNHWDFPGGRIDGAESIEETLRREVKEETGITDLKIKQLFAVTLARTVGVLGDHPLRLGLIIYLCQIEENSIITLSDEHSEYGWFPPHKAAIMLKEKYDDQFVAMVKNL